MIVLAVHFTVEDVLTAVAMVVARQSDSVIAVGQCDL